MNLFAELKRRNVLRMAGLYLVGAWLVLQVASTLLPIFRTPEWVLQALVVLLVAGIVPAVIVSWLYELTPEGMKRDTDAAVDAPTARRTARRLDRALVVGLLVVISLMAVERFWFAGRDAGVAASRTAHPRLAVLPLVNFSPDPGNAFFADGLHDDLLTALSRVRGMDVISRTTMQTFKDSKRKLSDIAQELDASHVLEGSVRRDAGTVRLTVQLIDAASDDHVWAETYERSLADATALQGAVTVAVAKALSLTAEGTVESAMPTAVPAAYDLYLKAGLLDNTRDSLPDVVKLLDSALLLDPGFTLARANRARVVCGVLWFDDTQRTELAAQARADIDQARREQPRLLDVDVAEATYRYYVQRDYPGALGLIDAVLLRNPNHVEALEARGNLLRRLDRLQEGLASHRRRYELDPNNGRAAINVAAFLSDLGRSREAVAVMDAALHRFPDSVGMRARRAGFEHNVTGDVDALMRAAQAIEGAQLDGPVGPLLRLSPPSAERIARLTPHAGEWATLFDGWRYPRALDIAWDADLLGDTAARDRFLARAAALYANLDPAVMARPGVRAYFAQFLALRGEHAAAVREAERALAEAPRSKDAATVSMLQRNAAVALARAGAKGRAIELLQAIQAAPTAADPQGAKLHDDMSLRLLLRDEPAYQALMRQIEAGYEKL